MYINIYIYGYIYHIYTYIIHTIWHPLDLSKPIILIETGPLWAWQNLWGYGRKVHAKFWPWGMPWHPIYDHLGPMLSAKVRILIDQIFLTRPYGHLRGWFLVVYYWISYEKSESGYTTSGGWTFCKFVDFRYKLKNRWEVGDFSKKVAIRLQRGAPLQLHSHRFDSLFLTICSPPIDLIHSRCKVITNTGGAGELKASELYSLVRLVWE